MKGRVDGCLISSYQLRFVIVSYKLEGVVSMMVHSMKRCEGILTRYMAPCLPDDRPIAGHIHLCLLAYFSPLTQRCLLIVARSVHIVAPHHHSTVKSIDR